VANNQAARDRASALAQGRRPHTTLDDDPSQNDDDSDSDSGGQVPAVTGSAAVETVIDRAMAQLGVTYSWGGGNQNGPTLGIRDGGVADRYGDYKKVGFDCSGLMVYAFAGIGISLPHYSGYQYTAGTQFPASQMKRGDMLFWGRGGSQHVALYLGDGQMIEAPQSGLVVRVAPVRRSGMMPNVVRMVS
jgi:cell wall-associated NlpC family hydrolase